MFGGTLALTIRALRVSVRMLRVYLFLLAFIGVIYFFAATLAAVGSGPRW